MNAHRSPSDRLGVPDFDKEANAQALKDLDGVVVDDVKVQAREEVQTVITGTVEDNGLYEMIKARGQRSTTNQPSVKMPVEPPKSWRKDTNVEPL
jgi:hypothetical protein